MGGARADEPVEPADEFGYTDGLVSERDVAGVEIRLLACGGVKS